MFNTVDDVLRLADPLFPRRTRRRAIDAAVAFVTERLNGEDGLGGIYPAMANAVMMFDCLGVPRDDPGVAVAHRAIKKLLWLEPGRSFCQPCLSPVWDTGLASLALIEAGGAVAQKSVRRGLDWLVSKQELACRGDWSVVRPEARPGGWAFQYANPHYPDLDDTAMVGIALDRFDRARYRGAVDRAAEWIAAMRSKSGGWGSFDADNEYFYLNFIPFADHGALLDPPTADVSARCVGFLAQLGERAPEGALAAGLDFLRREQEEDGSWFGRWGTNYIYGTWSVLVALKAAGIAKDDPMVSRAVDWLLSKQRADGGWGEDGDSYWPDQPHGEGKESTAAQTAWALLALMAAGEADNAAVARGIDHLVATQKPHGLWDEGVVHGGRISARVLSPLPRLPRLFPALGLGALSQLAPGQERAADLRHVMLPAAVTGLAAEAKILRRRGIAVLATAGDPARTAACAERLSTTAPTRPSVLRPRRRARPRARARRGAAAAPRAGRGRRDFPHRSGLARARAPVARRAARPRRRRGRPARPRRHRRDRRGEGEAARAIPAAAAVEELESHVAAAEARRARGAPFLVLRAICDPADFALPPAAFVGLDAAGRAAPGPVFLSLLRRPGQLGALLRLARHTRAALKKSRARRAGDLSLRGRPREGAQPWPTASARTPPRKSSRCASGGTPRTIPSSSISPPPGSASRRSRR